MADKQLLALIRKLEKRVDRLEKELLVTKEQASSARGAAQECLYLQQPFT